MDETEMYLYRKRLAVDFGLFAIEQATTKSQTINEPMTGRKAKEEGMARALQPQEVADWKEQFRVGVMSLADRGTPFTSEDVINAVGLPREVQQNRNNAVGAMMSAMARRGLIRKTGRRVQSQRPSSHCAEILEWVGVTPNTTED